MRVTLEVEIVPKDEWEDDGSYLYPVPRFSGFDVQAYVPSFAVQVMQDIITIMTKGAPKEQWVVNLVERVDKAPEG
jgi:hypothetical protein